MPNLVSSATLAGRPFRIAVAIVAVGLIGASPNPWPSLAKADRVPSPADCRADRQVETIECLGVVLPMTAGDVIEVAPGLSVVGQIPG